jgi:hypothetical protein
MYQTSDWSLAALALSDRGVAYAKCSDFRHHARAREIIEEFLPFPRITLGSPTVHRSYCAWPAVVPSWQPSRLATDPRCLVEINKIAVVD